VKMSLKGLIFFFHDWHENQDLSKLCSQGQLFFSKISKM
jgi:hypothetical protein